MLADKSEYETLITYIDNGETSSAYLGLTHERQGQHDTTVSSYCV